MAASDMVIFEVIWNPKLNTFDGIQVIPTQQKQHWVGEESCFDGQPNLDLQQAGCPQD